MMGDRCLLAVAAFVTKVTVGSQIRGQLNSPENYVDMTGLLYERRRVYVMRTAKERNGQDNGMERL